MKPSVIASPEGAKQSKNNILNIGSVKIPTNILLAPMAGCTDLPFRLITREHGAKFCFFEMVDCNSITYGAKRRVHSILKTLEEDRPIAAQLLGRDPSKMLAGAEEIIRAAKPLFLDINAACPAKKVIKKKCGAYLLKDESELCAIIKKLSSGLPIPVTVKLRIGYDKIDPGKIASLARRCEDSGASAIFVHGRTQVKGYSGPIDYASIKAIKESVDIPVFGSGNIFSPELAKKMLDETGCDGILVARGALGNPWIFEEISDYITKGQMRSSSGLEMRKSVIKKHISAIEKFKDHGSKGNVGHMRKAVLWYLKGFPLAARVREKVSLVNSYEEMLKLIDSL
ncbi:MAG: tRNA dihydrouridine synthase DusB [Candidatus Omnitrophota bacterium]|nr:tRNA dihydrouridine synthase DusB [Candidatus Omnitrophota bacterium]